MPVRETVRDPGEVGMLERLAAAEVVDIGIEGQQQIKPLLARYLPLDLENLARWPVEHAEIIGLGVISAVGAAQPAAPGQETDHVVHKDTFPN